MVQRRYNRDFIIYMEGEVLSTLDWQLTVFPVYEYVKMFVGQGCLFESEEILPGPNSQDNMRQKPTQ
jgi:hypothetical protein